MNLFGLSHHVAKFCFGFVIGFTVLLSGCGGGGSAGGSTSSLVSITVLPATNPIAVAIGKTVRLTAIGKYSDGTNPDITAKVAWTSASPATASVSSGVVTGVASGATTITATLNGVTSPVVNLTVTAGIVPTTGLATARWDHTANLLPASGVAGEMVLVEGGYTGGNTTFAALDSSELYDTATGLWSVTNGRLNIPRGDHTSTRLQNGKILIAGGASTTNSNIASSELYDPNTGLWSLTAGSLLEGRSYHTATLLQDGTVLVVGGGGVTSPSLNSAELYNPTTDSWTATGNLAAGRYSHTATLLPNGKVLVVGGVNLVGGVATYLATAELYDPVAKTWSSTGSLAKGRFSQTATLLTTGINAGKVLVIGGVDSTGFSTNSVELYDPASGTWTTKPPLNIARALHTATLLSNGTVLVMGGDDFNGNELSTVELYDPTLVTPTSTLMASLTTKRDNFTSTLCSAGVAAGKVLAAGGFDGTTALATTELH